MATAAQLRELRRKHGLGEFRKKGGSPNPSRRKKTRPRPIVSETVRTMGMDVARYGSRSKVWSPRSAAITPTEATEPTEPEDEQP